MFEGDGEADGDGVRSGCVRREEVDGRAAFARVRPLAIVCYACHWWRRA